MDSTEVLDKDLSIRENPIKSNIADGLRAAAGALTRRNQEGGNEGLSDLSNRAAQTLNRSADYVEEVDLGQIKERVVDQVRRNPGRTLLIAGVAGLIIGSLFRKR